MPPSRGQLLQTIVPTGNLDSLQAFLEGELPYLPPAIRDRYCMCLLYTCDHIPCSDTLLCLTDSAAKYNRIEIIKYLWDTFLGPRGVKANWLSLKAAACYGSIPMAEMFWTHDPECFQIREPPIQHKPGLRLSGVQTNTQIAVALRDGHYTYIDYILARGILDQKTIIYRLRFLIQRGAWVQNTGALRSAANRDMLEIVQFLLSNGANADDIGDESSPIHWKQISALICAAEKGREEIIKMLLQHEASISHRDRTGATALDTAKKNQQENAVSLLRSYECGDIR
ncbi:hypothetical protein N7510_006740 [Penicillium lagena]|uniref:uncharacterized protein n=1 Tax=Penicillium lagena TaxID=94218 RepID=UPI00254176EB|nr:uncharacterized protein N7510_006740 [Penicillium lagena]KAJ5610021.1 hypothetical protein N7510_006740 [Penicillium lagena]